MWGFSLGALTATSLAVRHPATVRRLVLAASHLRPDGYHDMQTLIAPIGLADSVRVHAFADPGVFGTLSLSLEVTGDPAMTPEKAHALLEAIVPPEDFYAFHIGLIKHGRRTCAARHHPTATRRTRPR